MKTILIPSDFSVQSLNCIEGLLDKFKGERLKIILIHVFLLSDSITELMLLARRSKEYTYISDAFLCRCRQLESQYWQQINSIHIECFYGSTVAVFKNYLEGNKIDLIVYPQDYEFRKLCKASFDPARLIAKSGKEVLVLREEQKKKQTMQYRWIKNMTYNLSLN